MPKIIRYQFMGSTFWFWLLCITTIGIPIALLYLLNGTIRVEHELKDPERFIEEFESGRLKKAKSIDRG